MTDEAPSSHASSPPCIQIRVAWGSSTIEVAHLDRPRAFTVAELARACDGVTPAPDEDMPPLVDVDASGWPCLVLDREREVDVDGGCEAREAAGDVVVLPRRTSDGRALQGLRLAIGDTATIRTLGVEVVVLAIDPEPVPRFVRRGLDRRTKLVAAGVFLGHLTLALGLMTEDDPVVDAGPTAEQIAEMQRLLKVAAENEEEDAEDDALAAASGDSKEGGTGTRAKGEEGSMGNPGTRATHNRYGVRGPADHPDPHVARQQALAESAEFGMIGILNSGSGGDPNAPTAPWGRDASGSGVGLGSVGTIGHGAGTGTGQGFGRGSGNLNGAHASSAPAAAAPRPEPLDPNGRFATTYRPGRGHLAAFEAALARGVLPPETREVVGDVAAGGGSALAAPTDRALAWRADFERARPAPEGGENHLRIALRSATRSAGRPRLSVHLVLDTSGSMQGEAMERAKQAAGELVGRLAPSDDFSLVAFSSGAEVKVPDGLVGPRRTAIQSVIDGLRADGGTNISEGLRLAYAEARSAKVPEDAVRVVLLMSDGRPNGGITGREPLARLALDAFQDGIQTSSFGLGADYDGALMSQIAADGAGGYYYVSTPDQIGAALSTELDRRLDPVALGVEVRVRLKPDVELLGVYGSRRLGASDAAKVRAQEVAVDVVAASKSGIARDREDDAEGGMRFFIPAFGRDDAHAILLKLRLPPGARERGVATVEVKAKDLLAKRNLVDEKPLRLTWADSIAASAASVDHGMSSTVQRFAAGEALAAASRRVEGGDTRGALALLDERVGLLRHASITLGDASLSGEADRLGRLRSFLDPSGAPSDPLAVAMLVDAASQSRLR